MRSRTPLFLAFLFLYLAPAFAQNAPAKQMTVADIWQDYRFYPDGVSGFNFLQDGKTYTRLKDNSIATYDLKSGKETGVILAGEALSGDCDCLCQECGITCCLDGGECAEAEACCLGEGCCRDAIDAGCDCPACDCPDCGEACCVGGDCEADDCCTAAGCCAA